MGLGYSGVVTQARIQKADLVNEQRQARTEETQDKRETNSEINLLTNLKNKLNNDKIIAEQKRTEAMNGTNSEQTQTIFTVIGTLVGGAIGGKIAEAAGKLIGDTKDAIDVGKITQEITNLNNSIASTENQIKLKQDALADRSTDRQTLLDNIEQEITACDEQIKDSKKQGEESTKEMFGANG